MRRFGTRLQGLLVIGKRENPADEVEMKSCQFVPFQKFAIMRLDRLHMLILFLFLPNRNAFASINKKIVLAQPTVILVSYDGFRWEYMEKVHTPNLNVIASNGIKAKHLLNTFVTKTFPNHFTLVAGLYEESHGIEQIRFSIQFSTTLST